MASRSRDGVAPRVLLERDAFFALRRNRFSKGSVWALSHRRPISWIATLLNLYCLVSAIRMIESFAPLTVDDYAISALGTAQCDPHDAKEGRLQALLHKLPKLQEDMSSELAVCRAQLHAAGELGGLHFARVAYWYLWYAAIGGALAVDFVRLCGLSTAVGDLLLGFHSHASEKLGVSPYLLGLVPFVHLSYFYTAALKVPCCVGTPKLAVAVASVRSLAFLLFVSLYCLFGDAHHNGYFLLRIPAAQRSAHLLLRERLAAPPSAARGAVEAREDAEVSGLCGSSV